MFRLEAAMVVVFVALDVFSVIDLIQTPEDRVRNLPKLGWLLLILLFTPIGAIAWLVAGRPAPDAGAQAAPGVSRYPEYDRPGRAQGLSPESDEEFLRRVRERAEEQRRRYADQVRENQRAEEAERQGRRDVGRTDGPEVADPPGEG